MSSSRKGRRRERRKAKLAELRGGKTLEQRVRDIEDYLGVF